MRILITGGAGFIGRYTARECIAQGHSVQILDSYAQQIHGQKAPTEINDELRAFILGSSSHEESLDFVQGDVCDHAALKKCLLGKDAVIHLAAETGTGQSMYDVTRYERVNIGGTALLAELLASGEFAHIRRVVLASSRAVYGEGQYACEKCGAVFPPVRETKQMQAGFYQPRCPRCQGPINCVPTTEQAPRSPTSFYGLTKSVQEDIVRMFAESSGFSAYILRFQNVYGPMQSLTNPYTGILSIFSTLARANQTIKIFEDGLESRDFVHVEDISRAIVACLSAAEQGVATLNLGTGEATTVFQVAETLRSTLNSKSEIVVTGQFRVGDIRHAVADISAAKAMLGYQPRVKFADGIEQFMKWVTTQSIASSLYERSLKELSQKGLLLEKR